MKRINSVTVIQLSDLARQGLGLLDQELTKLIDDDVTQEDFVVIEIKKTKNAKRKKSKAKERRRGKKSGRFVGDIFSL